ncbi:GNAT family N-acetyltransferase [Thalassotalea marina]|uniref:N-acetyltransferase n=1 Tax=Thalassotalea marina TaxID=1673741 RepID=A0A919EMT4_9GAMM|nr:GNAT family N-acetyltransferase [Thalassotalea marina]GHG01311.1 N-acetyltransferase [Thalassotalea marina]
MLKNKTIPFDGEIIDNLCGLYSHFDKLPETVFCNNEDVTYCKSKLPFPAFNCVINTNLTSESANSKVEDIIGCFSQLNLPFCWNVSRSSLPVGLDNILKNKGFVLADTQSGMSMNILGYRKSERQTNLEINVVSAREELDLWATTFQQGFEIPEFVSQAFLEIYRTFGFEPHSKIRCFIGFYNNKPVCTAALFFTPKSAGIYSMSTIPDFRRMGFGQAIAEYILEYAAKLGNDKAVLFATDAGKRIYKKLGFVENDVSDIYLYNK